MKSRRTIRSVCLRLTSATALLLFLAAQGLCFVQCHSGRRTGDATETLATSCHGVACHKSPGAFDGTADEDDSTAAQNHDPRPANSATCLTFKTMLSGGEAPLLAPHPMLIVFTLALHVPTACDDASFPIAAAAMRQARLLDACCKPVVCLDPALHTNAPPLTV